MARPVSTAKLLATFAHNAAVVVSRRNYSPQGVILNAARGGKRGVMKQGEEKQMKEGGKCSWMPDPVTGHYVPEDRVGDIDAAELREILLNHRSKESSEV